MPPFLPTTLRFASLSAASARHLDGAIERTLAGRAAEQPGRVRSPAFVSGRSYRTALSAFLTGSLLSLGNAQASSLTWPGHVNTGLNWVNHIVPANNFYGSSPVINWDENKVLHATSECGSFTTQLLLQSYENVITADVLTALAGSNSPSAAQWHDAIDPARIHANASSNGVFLHTLDHAYANPTGRTLRHAGTGLLAVGDILAAKYVSGSATGHVMTVYSITQPGVAVSLSGTSSIPGVTMVRRWTVQVLDSTSSVHGSLDTRYQKDRSEPDGHDHGLGLASIYLYEDASAGSASFGQLVGWTWSTASAYTFQFRNMAGIDNNGKTTYRPMVIGRFGGTGL